MDLQLQNQVVIITGAASGIGRACATQFLEEGAAVVGWDLAPCQIPPGCDGRKFQTQQVDITQPDQVLQALRQSLEIAGRLDHLVHAAAIGSGKFGFPFTQLAPEDWRRTIEVNVLGTANVAHAVVPVLRDQGRGSLCLIASVAGQIGSQTDPPYSASKAANINFAQCMAKDLAPHGVRVNVVNPGMVQTPLNRSVWQAWHDSQPPADRQSYEEWAQEKIRKVVPLGRWQTVQDIANMVVFLASDRCRNITGQCINIDGGFVMHW
jgi:NAD(P)-dependent dehydrogenase (short-subunit alcohol dehydrogenase family)